MLSVIQLAVVAAAALGSPAREWAQQHRVALGLDPRVELSQREVFSTRFGASVHFAAAVGGVELDSARVVVTLGRFGEVVFADSDVPAFGSVVLEEAFDGAALSERAARSIPLALRDAAGVPLGGRRRVLFVVAGSLHVGAWVWVPTPRQTDNWEVAVDAVTGQVLGKQNRRYRAANDAQVYDPSPGGLDAGVGATPTVPVRLERRDGGPMVTVDSGVLEGDFLAAWNCCLSEGCDPDAGPKVVMNYTLGADGGYLGFDGGTVVRSVVCDRVHRASNDPSLHASGDYVYPPLDGAAPLSQTEPVFSDEFSEVHAFFHANRIVEWVEQLSSGAPGLGAPFRLRDARRSPPVPMLVQTNFVEADLGSDLSFGCLFFGFCDFSRFAFLGNAMFVPRENYPVLKLPALFPDSDGVYFFQGPSVDFAYDATVVRHEVGHAVIQATAGLRFSHPRVERTWANDEGGAMHEGIADFLAAAYGNDPEIGRYIGPNRDRTLDGPLRTVANGEQCPGSLWGAVHEDGRIFSGALWQGRQVFGAQFGVDRFDAALYAALVAMTPSANFDTAALTVVALVELAFPELPDAANQMRDIFMRRGVIGCGHQLEVDGGLARLDQFGMAGPPVDNAVRFGAVPGPYQLHFSHGVRGGTVEVHSATKTFGVEVWTRQGAPVEFVAADGGLTGLADSSGRLEDQGVYVPVPCVDPQDVYVAFSSRAGYPVLLREVTVELVDDGRCVPQPVEMPVLGELFPAAPRGCGCSASRGPLVLLAALLLRRRPKGTRAGQSRPHRRRT